MRKFYISALFLITLVFSEKTFAQVLCHASFYLDTTKSTAFNAVLVNNSVSYLTLPDSALYLWMWGDGSSSVGKTPTHTYTSPGSKFIFLQMTSVNKTCGDSTFKMIVIDSLGGFHKRNGSYTIRVVNPVASGINSAVTEALVFINPNIVKDHADLTFNGLDKNAMVQVDIFSYDGKKALSVSETLNGNTLQLQTSAMKSGMYFAVVKAEGKTSLVRFVKQ